MEGHTQSHFVPFILANATIRPKGRHAAAKSHTSHDTEGFVIITCTRTFTSLTQPGSASLSAPLHVKTRIVPVEAERHSGHSAQVCSEAQPTHRHRCEHGSSRTARGSWVVEFTRQ